MTSHNISSAGLSHLSRNELFPVGKFSSWPINMFFHVNSGMGWLSTRFPNYFGPFTSQRVRDFALLFWIPNNRSANSLSGLGALPGKGNSGPVRSFWEDQSNCYPSGRAEMDKNLFARKRSLLRISPHRVLLNFAHEWKLQTSWNALLSGPVDAVPPVSRSVCQSTDQVIGTVIFGTFWPFK